MDYLIVKDRQQVIIGPMGWRQRTFQSEINDLFENGDITEKYTIAPVENGYVNLGEGVEIFPVQIDFPQYDPFYEQLAGPFYTYENNIAVGTYNVISVDIALSKAALKVKVTDDRYLKEIAGIKVTIQGHEVTADTARGSRDIFAQTYFAMSESETINWKFPEMWLLVTKSDMATIVNAGKNHIQSCFNWELNLHTAIDNAQTVEELKNISLE
jgi:hypothetical protein